MILSRRRFLIGSAGLIAAPAILRVAGIMPIKSIILPPPIQIEDPNWPAWWGEDDGWTPISAWERAGIMSVSSQPLNSEDLNDVRAAIKSLRGLS